MSNSPSPYAAPNTPIASAKRPRFAKKDMQSPLRNTAAISSLAAGAGPELKHKSTSASSSSGAEKKYSKGLFSPTGTASAADDEEEARLNTIYTGVSVGGAQGGTSTPKRTSSGTLRQSSDNYEQTDLCKASGADGSASSETDALQAQAGGDGKEDEDTGPSSAAQQADTAAAEDEDDGGVFNPYQFISGLPPLDSIERNPVSLAPSSDVSKPTLVLDLDETLVHCTVVPIPNPDMTFPVTFNGVLYDVYVRKRPYLDYFLEVVSRSFEVVVFTASQRVYADVLLDLLDPEKKFVQHRLFRESCVMVQGNYLKDLHVVGREYHRMVLVDNSPHAYGFQIENGIPIESWFDDDNDTELLKLVGFLRKAFAAGDVRPVIREQFKTHDLIERARRGLSIDLNVCPQF